MSARWSCDVALAPERALQRLAVAIDQRPKRAFGVLKTQNEFVGAISGTDFEVWERRQRAVHAVGSAQPRAGGSRVVVRFVIPPVTRFLLVLFFALYVAVAVGIATQPPDTRIIADELIIAAAGAAVTGGLFYGAARRQTADLTSFLEAVFTERERR